ncbi:GtrA family protein [Streptomyces sp. URMC 123]|uniref:GtrA family protein n=1 Tax=Streptomyces sp. URMC 123 TaxID=3423403 RepID=UPI003F1C6A66
MRQRDFRQVIRFALVGVVNTGTNYGCYRLLHPWLPYMVATFLAILLSMVVAFFLHVRFTYRTRPTWRKFLLFPLTNITSIVVTMVGTFVLVSWVGMDERFAPLTASLLAIPATFVVSRKILVTRGPAASQAAGAPVAVAEGQGRA